MSITIIDDTSDVGIVRKLLAQAGRATTNVREDDILSVFSNSGNVIVYTDFSDLMDLAGVYLADDITHSGTNYASGSTLYPKSGEIYLSQALPPNTEQVLVRYASRDGLSNGDIQINIDIAKDFLQMELWETTLDYSGSSVYEGMARHAMLTMSSYFALLTMNNANAIQSGYNYRIAEFEIQTKLWGEGMIAETLLNKYWERTLKMMNALKLYQDKPNVPIYVVNRKNSMTPYNNDPMIFNNANVTIERTTLYDSRSEYGIIIKVIG